MDLGHGGFPGEKEVYVLHEVPGTGYNCLMHCVLSAFRQQGLKWADVTSAIDDRLDKVLQLAGIEEPLEDEAGALLRNKLKCNAGAVDASLAVGDLRKLLLNLLKFVARAAATNHEKYNGCYGIVKELKSEAKKAEGTHLLGWGESLPLLTDLLFPKGQTTFLCYARLFPGADGWMEHSKYLNADTIHTLNPQTQRLSKGKLCMTHFVGEYVAGDKEAEVLQHKNDQNRHHVHRFTHCKFGDMYGTVPGGHHDHYVPMEEVGKINENTTKENAAKWALGILNAARVRDGQLDVSER